MINNKKILAVIPARGGSKGIINKNISNLGGLPLIAWSINAAKFSKFIDCVHVSTNDKEIAEVSKFYGADVPFLRPDKFSTDTSSTYDAINFTLLKYEELNQYFDLVIELQPTYPFRINRLIDKCINTFIENKLAKSLITIIQTKSTEHSEYCVKLNNYLINFNKMPSDFSRHNLNLEYSFHGIFICTYVQSFKSNKNMCDKHHTLGYEINKGIESLDINIPFDLFTANCTADFYHINTESLKEEK